MKFQNTLILAITLLLGSPGFCAYQYHPDDFAAEVISYTPGTDIVVDSIDGQLFDDPNTTLGRPTLETTGDNLNIDPAESVPVVPVYQPFRHFELVTIGNGGQLIVKFNHPVADDQNNPYGMDFIIFGNAAGRGTDEYWSNGDPRQFFVARGVMYERGIVSVSQDGQTWYTYTNGPYADDFAPTASYEFELNPQDPNDFWGPPLDPTRPIDPGLTPEDFNGKTVAQIVAMYDGSAGGTPFDIAPFGLDWILYVRIQDNPNSSATTEIDALADVSACGDYQHPLPPGDLNADCRVNLPDLALLAAHWLTCSWQCE